MFLSWIAKSELLKTSDETHVLKKFPLRGQTSICSTVIKFLTDESASDNVLTSASQIKWAMEAIGHSFALKMDEIDIISASLNLYEKWLGVHSSSTRRETRPVCMLDVEQQFIQDMIGHMSLLFEVRSGSSKSLDKHVVLCQKCLDIFSRVGQFRGKELSAATWNRILRILVGITDHLLHGTKSAIGARICAELYRTTLELYLRSLSTCGAMGDLWRILTKFSKRWIHRRRVIEQWNAVLLELTQQTMRLLYSPRTDQQPDVDELMTIQISWTDHATSTVLLSRTSLSYAWYRIFYVVAHPNYISDPDVYAVAMTGMGTILDILTSVGLPTSTCIVEGWERVRGALGVTQLEVEDNALSRVDDLGHRVTLKDSTDIVFVFSAPSEPDVNAILRLLGPWFFDATLNRSNEFSTGRAVAIRCLGRLICGRSGGNSKKILTPHTSRFLETVYRALQNKESDRVIASAIYSCAGVFGTNSVFTLRGNGILTGPFLQAVTRLYSKLIKVAADEKVTSSIGGISAYLIRRSCLFMLGSLVILCDSVPNSLAKQIESALLPQRFRKGPTLLSQFPEYSYIEVIELLFAAIAVESDSFNQQIALWQIGCALQLTHSRWERPTSSKNTPVVETAIAIIGTEMTSTKCRWNAPVLFTALDCLRQLACICESIRKVTMVGVVTLVTRCCEFISAHSDTFRTGSPPIYLDAVVASAYACVIEWVVAAPWMLSHADMASKIINAAVDGSDLRGQRSSRDAVSIRLASRKLMSLLFRHLGSYPNPSTGPIHRSSLLTEALALEASSRQLQDDRARCFVYGDHSIISVIENPPNEAILIIRDPSGRYCWTLQPHDQVKSKPSSPLKPKESVTTDPALRTFGLKDDPLFQTLKTSEFYLESDSMSTDGSFKTLLGAQMVLEKSTDSIPDEIEACVYPTKERDDADMNPWQNSRRLMTQLGLISIENWGSLVPLTYSSDLLDDLNELDSKSERELYKIGLHYVKSESSQGGCDALRFVTSSNDTSLDYLQFLYQLGWIVDAVGPLAKVTPESTKGLYYGTYDLEMKFLVPTLDPSLASLDGNELIIIWNAAQQQIYPTSKLLKSLDITIPKSRIYILIDPLQPDRYRIRIIQDESPIYHQPTLNMTTGDEPSADKSDLFKTRVLGPLQNGMIVDGKNLGSLVRQTALNAVRLSRSYRRYQHSIGAANSSHRRAAIVRDKWINTIVKKYSKPVLPGEFYGDLF